MAHAAKQLASEGSSRSVHVATVISEISELSAKELAVPGSVSSSSGGGNAKAGKLATCAWQELQDALRQEWSDFSQTLEGQLDDHLRRQELLMNQQALRIEGMLAKACVQEQVSKSSLVSTATSTCALYRSSKTEKRRPTENEDKLPEKEVRKPLEATQASASSAEKPPPPVVRPLDERTMKNEDSSDTAGKRTSSKPTSSPVQSMHEASTGRQQAPSSPAFWRRAGTRQRSFAVRFGLEQVNSYQKRRSLSLRLEKMQSRMGSVAWKVLGDWIDWWLAIKEPPVEGLLSTIVDGKFFEFLSGLVILCNSVVTVYTTNYEAAHLYEDVSSHIRVLNAGFAAYYTCEIILKITIHRIYFFCNTDMAWNIFDFSLVLLAIFDLLLSELQHAADGQVNLNHMRTVRILRTAKILRMVRIIRFFSELKLIMNSVLGSLISLFWSVLMLVFMFFIFSLIFVQGATITLINEKGFLADEQREHLQETLGSTELGMLTLFKSATGGEDWSYFFRAIKLTGAGNCALFLFFIAFAQFALLNILTGLYVEKAMKLAQPDRDTIALQQRERELTEADELRRLCSSIDTEDKGLISEEQFMATLKNPQFKARMSLLGLDIKDASFFFKIICSSFDRKEVEIDAFVSGAMRLKGSASSLDLQALAFGTKLIHSNQIKFYNQVEERLKKIMDKLKEATEL